MTRHRQPENKISDRLIELCTSGESVSSLVAQDPSLAPGDAWEKLYSKRRLKATTVSGKGPGDGSEGAEPQLIPQDELEKAARCGKWGPTRPSELFLRVGVDM